MKTLRKFMFPCAIVVLGLAACSQTEDTPSAPRSNEENAIRFAAATEFTRADSTYRGDITINNLKSFYVYALIGTGTKPIVFMDHVEVMKIGENDWSYSPVRFWPVDESVNFYAYAPKGWINDSLPANKPVPYETKFGTQDIIYASAPDLSGYPERPNAQVIFNFRHALSKLTVKLSSSNTTLKVNVTNVALINVASKGNFNFPSGSTADDKGPHSVGFWSDQNTPLNYALYVSQDTTDIITLTTTPNDLSSTPLGLGGSKYLIPQTLTWRSNGSGKDSYITVMCSIYDKETGEKLWPNENTPKENIVEGSTFGDGLLKFPLSTSGFSKWAPGNHYIYNIVINSNEEMGAIQFGSPTVDTFVDVTTNYN